VTTEDLIKLVEIDNKEYLYYKAIAPNIAFIRATTCDSEGYATFEDEVMYLDALVIAQAVHNNGGIVDVQKMVKKATLHPKAGAYSWLSGRYRRHRPRTDSVVWRSAG
jgi:acetate CoA-transferase